jgi:hypothetical protein
MLSSAARMAFRGKKRRRKNLDAPEPLEELLDRAGEDRFAKKRVPIPVREWRAAVGPRIADRARPWTLERGVLTVKVTTSVWANELQMLAPELVARLRQRGFLVDSLRFRVGQLDQQERPPERRTFRKVPPPKPLSPELKAEVSKVEDDGLRAVIEAAARANLSWQENVNPTSPTAGPPASRGPRDAGRGSAPRDRNEEGSGAASRRSSEDGAYRRR